MDIFWTIIVAALAVQFLVDIIKQPIPEAYRSWSAPIISLAFSMLFCFFGHVDLFPAIGINFDYGWLGELFTAIAISGGASGVNELIKVVKNKKLDLKNSAVSIDDVIEKVFAASESESHESNSDKEVK